MNSKNNKLHEFEPTDSQGWEMQCLKCGKEINIFQVKEYEEALKEKCNENINLPIK